MMSNTQTTNVIVVGGGLAGLTVATLLARAGRTVRLFEKARELGGRADTQVKSEFHFNLGPHALYRGGAGMRMLRDLGVAFTGAAPNVAGGYAVAGGKLHTFPGGLVSLLTTGLLRWTEKREAGRIFATLPKIDPQPLLHLTVQAWLERVSRYPKVRQLLQAFFRVSTYANAPEHLSAGVALAQAQLALTRGVLYLDGGWHTLVQGLRTRAEQVGVVIVTGQRVAAVEHDEAVRGVRLADGSFLPAAAVVLTGSPNEAAALAPQQSDLQAWAAAATPIKAACLDVGLSHLPKPKALFALGVDQPLYCSVHSAVAKLGPTGGATIHVAKYLDPMEDAEADAHELEQLLDLMQPGWRKVTVERRFLPHLTVYHALPTAAGGGLAGRPGPFVPGVRHLCIAGDWVGAEGLLADASFASAKRAAELILAGGQEQAEIAA